MSKDQKPAENNVVAMTTCCVEKCTKKGGRLNFCPEHYAWFKEGLVDKAGHRPTDFDKKFHDYQMRTGKKAA